MILAKKKKLLMAFLCYYYIVPEEIKLQGKKAQSAYLQALRDGSVHVYRGRILLIGQDRAGKTSLKKSLTGRPFNPEEQSTEGIHVDPSTFEIDVDQVKNWQSVCENEQGLLGCSRDIAKIVTTKLPEYSPSISSNGSSEYGEDDTDASEEHQENDSEYSENDYMKFTEEAKDTDKDKDKDRGSRDAAVVRALASQQCGPGLIPGLGVRCGLSLLLVLVFAPRGFSPGTPVFPSPQNQHF